MIDAAFIKRTLTALLPPLLLIVAVLGAILGGIATPTEAASVGAIGAILLGAARVGHAGNRLVFLSVASLAALLLVAGNFDLRMARAEVALADQIAFYAAIGLTVTFVITVGLALRATGRSGVLMDVSRSTLKISTMIYTILIGASLFSLVFRGLGGDGVIEHWLTNLPGGTTGAIILVMLLMFVLGFFLDFIEICFVVVPVVAPALLAMDGVHGPVWLAVLMAMNLQTSFLTPPFGFALFYLRGVVPDEVKTSTMYRGVLPFILIQLAALLVIALDPGLVTWLPDLLFKG